MSEIIKILSVGALFGIALDLAEFGSAKKLNSQFLGRDFTMFKVMFGGILFAAAVYALAVDWGAAAVDENLIPTLNVALIIGGFLLGMALVIGGYCPGTAIVASANGKLDAILFLLMAYAGYCIPVYRSENLTQRLYSPMLAEHMTLQDLTGLQNIVILLSLILILFAVWRVASRIEKSVN